MLILDNLEGLTQVRPHKIVRSLPRYPSRLLLALIVFLFLWVSQAVGSDNKLADQRNVIFDRIGSSEGLSQGSVQSITQDQQGFLWIGTQEGLNRYDGHSFQTYYHIQGVEGSLSHDFIRSLLADSSGRFWVGTDSGLNLYDSASNQFTLFNFDLTGDANRSAVYDLHEDESGSIWIGASSGLFKLSQEGELSEYSYDLTDPTSLGKGSVRALFQSSDGAFWVGTELGGLSKFDPKTGRSVRFQFSPNDPNTIGDNYVRDIIEDEDGRLWAATFNGGLSIYDPKTENWDRISAGDDNGYGVGSNRVRALLKDQSGNIWVGTDVGLNLWRPDSQDFLSYVVDVTNVRSISDNTVLCIFQDAGGVIWVGTFNGVNKWNANVETFPHFKQRSITPSELTSSSTSSFAEAPNGDVWIGTFSGLNLWNSVEGRLEALSSDELGLTDARIMSLLVVDDSLWVGTMAGGVNLISDRRVLSTFRSTPHDANSLSSNAVSSIYQDKLGRVWLTTYGGGVNRYMGDGKFKRFPDLTNSYGKFSNMRALDIVEAADGTMWIATEGGGVIVLDPESGDTLTFRFDPLNDQSLSSDMAISLLRTGETMWVGTLDRGLNRFEPSTGSFRRYSKSQGLASDAVYGMLEDDNGNIWISGGKGLSVLNPKTNTFQLYDSTHGLQADDFNSGASLKLSDGSFIFGGNNGFNAFDPTRIHRNDYVPPVRLTSFSKFNKQVELPVPIDRAQSIELEYTDFVIGFEFSSLDYTAPAKNQYKYKLEGFDPDWVDSDGGRTATYTNLDAGQYVFKVKGSNNDGVWNEEGAAVEVIVKPPIWATWWAYLVYGVLLAVVLHQVYRAYTARLQREAEKRYSDRLQLYIESLEEATDCVLIADHQGKLIYANNATRSILGQTPAEAVGKPLVSVVFEDQGDSKRALVALEQFGRYHGEVTYLTDDGNNLATEVTIAAVREIGEHGSAFVSISRDITNRKKTEEELENHRRNLEQLVTERTSALEREIAENKATQVNLADSLEEKELLLKEVHHRVKNNMQVISSLLNIQAETADNELFSSLLGESQQRIKSMSLIHENLYQSDNLLEIDFEDYIEMLANSLCRFYAVPGVDVILDVRVDDVSLDIETAVPCGLIINELVSNSLKHAFKGRQGTGTISIAFKQAGCGYALQIRDDGVGLPRDFQLDSSSSMGMEIVSILTQQLDGKIRTLETEGAGFEILFPRTEKHG